MTLEIGERRLQLFGSLITISGGITNEKNL